MLGVFVLRGELCEPAEFGFGRCLGWWCQAKVKADLLHGIGRVIGASSKGIEVGEGFAVGVEGVRVRGAGFE